MTRMKSGAAGTWSRRVTQPHQLLLHIPLHRSVQMNYTALWWPIVQMAILVVAGVIQVQYLKSFFKKKKLI
jgi:emp24/gp25L/p24 family/GOLD